jgi:hypothetical protein
MTVTKEIRYTTKSESADENERPIRGVLTALATQNAERLRYAAFRLDDGVSLLHVAVLDDNENPLSRSAAFGAFQSAITDRWAERPRPAVATVKGSYRLWPE